MSVQYIEYVRKPFKVTAVEFTVENIEQLNKEFKIGTLERKPEDGSPFITVTNVQKVPNVTRVFPGFLLTKMGKNIRVFTRRIFFEQFGEMSPEWAAYFAEEAAGG